MYYYLLLFCLIAGVIKGLFFAENDPRFRPSKNLVDFLIPGLYKD